MLLVDMSQLVIANICAIQTSKTTRQDFTLDFVRKVILRGIKDVRLTHSKDGVSADTVLCCDARSYWRTHKFPYYKANRPAMKAAIPGIDWDLLYQYYDIVKDEIRENLPVKLIQIDGAEADDIIAVLAQINVPSCYPGKARDIFDFDPPLPIVIVSSDGDFQQLHEIPQVQQWNPRTKKFMRIAGSVDSFLKEKIIRGDTGDGVPNMLSDDDTFVNPAKRQKPLSKNIFNALMESEYKDLTDEQKRNFDRNRLLVDLNSKIPDKYRTEIMNAYETYEVPHGKVFNYLMKNKLTMLMSDPRGLD